MRPGRAKIHAFNGFVPRQCVLYAIRYHEYQDFLSKERGVGAATQVGDWCTCRLLTSRTSRTENPQPCPVVGRGMWRWI